MLTTLSGFFYNPKAPPKDSMTAFPSKFERNVSMKRLTNVNKPSTYSNVEWVQCIVLQVSSLQHRLDELYKKNNNKQTWHLCIVYLVLMPLCNWSVLSRDNIVPTVDCFCLKSSCQDQYSDTEFFGKMLFHLLVLIQLFLTNTIKRS